LLRKCHDGERRWLLVRRMREDFHHKCVLGDFCGRREDDRVSTLGC
jgi:hypothetical protein